LRDHLRRIFAINVDEGAWSGRAVFTGVVVSLIVLAAGVYVSDVANTTRQRTPVKEAAATAPSGR